MQEEKYVVQETTRQFQLPTFDMTDVLTILVVLLISGLLMTDRPVPEYLIALVTLGAGIKVNTAQQVKAFRE